jgi:hypothetical protein
MTLRRAPRTGMHATAAALACRAAVGGGSAGCGRRRDRAGTRQQWSGLRYPMRVLGGEGVEGALKGPGAWSGMHLCGRTLPVACRYMT